MKLRMLFFAACATLVPTIALAGPSWTELYRGIGSDSNRDKALSAANRLTVSEQETGIAPAGAGAVCGPEAPIEADAVCGASGYSCGTSPSNAICCNNNQSCCTSSGGAIYCGNPGCNRG